MVRASSKCHFWFLSLEFNEPIGQFSCICSDLQARLPFRYPGNKVTWEQFGDVSDAELIAEQEVWASVDPSGKNQAFNVTNGDVFKYKSFD